jgi:hypothetical protein
MLPLSSRSINQFISKLPGKVNIEKKITYATAFWLRNVHQTRVENKIDVTIPAVIKNQLLPAALPANFRLF